MQANKYTQEFIDHILSSVDKSSCPLLPRQMYPFLHYCIFFVNHFANEEELRPIGWFSLSMLWGYYGIISLTAYAVNQKLKFYSKTINAYPKIENTTLLHSLILCWKLYQKVKIGKIGTFFGTFCNLNCFEVPKIGDFKSGGGGDSTDKSLVNA